MRLWISEKKDLYGRLMVLPRSNRDIDLDYELTLTSRALLAPNRSMLECHGKTDLIHELEARSRQPKTINKT